MKTEKTYKELEEAFNYSLDFLSNQIDCLDIKEYDRRYLRYLIVNSLKALKALKEYKQGASGALLFYMQKARLEKFEFLRLL